MSLDDDLAAWAATVRLPDGDAAAIFRRIVAAPVGLSAGPPATAPSAAVPQLSPSWWRRYNAGFAARMVASTAPVRLAA
jgi:hypothetical protein